MFVSTQRNELLWSWGMGPGQCALIWHGFHVEIVGLEEFVLWRCMGMVLYNRVWLCVKLA